MTYPDPIGIPPHPRTAGEPLHDHEFEEQVDTHLLRLEAERPDPVTPAEEKAVRYWGMVADRYFDEADAAAGHAAWYGSIKHASPSCACGVNDAGQRFVDPICHRPVPEVEQARFEEQVAVPAERLEAERSPVTPAEERTGVSDVQHAVVGEVEAIRRLLPQLRVAEREYMREPAEYLKDTADDIAEGLMRRLDRIEQWVRGEQR